MSLKENIRIAIFNIRTNLLRSGLTMLGIIIGVASVIAIITIGNGGRDYLIDMIKDMGTNCVSIGLNATSVGRDDYIDDADIDAIRKIETVEGVSPLTMNYGTISTDKDNGVGILLAVNTDFFKIINGSCKYGRIFSKDDYDAARNVAVIDVASAWSMFGSPSNAVGKEIEYFSGGTSTKLKIIGVGDLGSFDPASSGGGMSANTEMYNSDDLLTGGMFIIPSTTYANIYNSSLIYDMIYISTESEEDLDTAGNAAKVLLQVRHDNFDDGIYIVNNMATYVDLLNTVIKIFTTFIACVSGISLLVGGIGVMNIMFVTVTERTREIGIRKALGAKTKTIMFQFLTESVILCLIGGIIGLILGVGAAAIAALAMGVAIHLEVSSIIISVGFSSAIGIFFGIYPARRAAKMPPIEALRRQ